MRDSEIDIARGLCIVFMILTHMENWWQRTIPFIRYTKVFFLVFFFFCSGLYFHKPADYRKFFISKCKRLLLPYVIVCGLLMSVRLVQGFRFEVVLNSFFVGLSADLEKEYVFSGLETIGVGPIWFLQSLFVANMIACAFCEGPLLFRLGLAGILLVLSIESQKVIALPFSLQTSIIGCFFLVSGQLLSPYIRKGIIWIKTHYLLSIIPAVFCTVLYCSVLHYIPKQFIDLGSNYFSYEALIGTHLGIFTLLCVAVYLEKTPFINKLFQFIGKNSLIILIIHSLDIMWLRDWSKMSWLFAGVTFALYLGVTYLIVIIKTRFLSNCRKAVI